MNAATRRYKPHSLCRLCELRPRWGRSYCPECCAATQALYDYWRRVVSERRDITKYIRKVAA